MPELIPVAQIERLESRRLLAVTPVTNDKFVTADSDDSELLIVDTAGDTTVVDAPSDNPQDASFSPDRTEILFDGQGSNVDSTYEIFTINVDGTGFKRLTTNTSKDYEPAFSPDGSTIIWDSNRSGDYHLYRMDAGTGANVKQLTTGSGFDDVQATYNSDGQQIAFISSRGGHHDVWVMNADGSNPSQFTSLATDDLDFSHPAWSPDGTRIAYEVDGVDTSSVFTVSTSSPDIVPEQLIDDMSFPSWASTPQFAGVFGGVLTVVGTSAADSITVASHVHDVG